MHRLWYLVIPMRTLVGIILDSELLYGHELVCIAKVCLTVMLKSIGSSTFNSKVWADGNL